MDTFFLILAGIIGLGILGWNVWKLLKCKTCSRRKSGSCFLCNSDRNISKPDE